MGGGFNQLAYPIGEPDAGAAFFIGAIIKTPWESTNVRVPRQAFIETVDGERLECWEMKGAIKVGRPPYHPAGSPLISAFAAPVAIHVPEPTDVNVVLEVGTDRGSHRVSVRRQSPAPNADL